MRDIVRLGHPTLREPVEAVPEDRIGSAELDELIDEMVETVRSTEGVGLAAPQLGVAWQLFVYDEEAGSGDGIFRAVLNPMVEPHVEEMVHEWEGCLSIPDLLGLVPRYAEVRLCGLDRRGDDIDRELSGFTARIVQHEYDHLHGVVFLDRMRDLRSLAYSEEWSEFAADDERKAVG